MKEIKQPRYLARSYSLAGEKNTTIRFPDAEKEGLQQRYKIKECSQLLTSGNFSEKLALGLRMFRSHSFIFKLQKGLERCTMKSTYHPTATVEI